MIITLTTDFGTADTYVGVMKGVILQIAPEVQVVDISHSVSSHSVMEGAFKLASAARFFPPGTIHVGVVDPGVGSARKPIAGFDGSYFFVGPNNGLLSLCLDKTADLHHITNDKLFQKPTSATFHGRDIFAPISAHLALGEPLEAVGPALKDYYSLIPSLARPQVLHVDKFGNVVTSLRSEDIALNICLRIGDYKVRKTHQYYSESLPGELFMIAGSVGYIEICINQASAADRLGVQAGDEFELETLSGNKLE